MVKRSLIFLVLFIMIVGCSSITGKDSFAEQINALEQSFVKEDWHALKIQISDLKAVYEENKWKVQLLGDEGEYERLDESINRLIVAIDEEEQIEGRLELSTIKNLIKDIYSM